jgi:hypothetical protein
LSLGLRVEADGRLKIRRTRFVELEWSVRLGEESRRVDLDLERIRGIEFLFTDRADGIRIAVDVVRPASSTLLLRQSGT